jgi:hypothetical protein
VQDAVVQLTKQCPDLVYKQLKALSWVRGSKCHTIRPIGEYWVDEDQYPVAVQQRIIEYPATHS